MATTTRVCCGAPSISRLLTIVARRPPAPTKAFPARGSAGGMTARPCGAILEAHLIIGRAFGGATSGQRRPPPIAGAAPGNSCRGSCKGCRAGARATPGLAFNYLKSNDSSSRLKMARGLLLNFRGQSVPRGRPLASVASDTSVVQSSARADAFAGRLAAAQAVEQPSHFASLLDAAEPVRDSAPARTDTAEHSTAPVRRDESRATGSDTTAKSATNPPDQKGAKGAKPAKTATEATGAKNIKDAKNAGNPTPADKTAADKSTDKSTAQAAASQAPADPAQSAAPAPTATTDQGNATNTAQQPATPGNATNASAADGTTTPNPKPDKPKSSDKTTADQGTAAPIDQAIAAPAALVTPDPVAVVTPVATPAAAPVGAPTTPAATASGAAPIAAPAAA